MKVHLACWSTRVNAANAPHIKACQVTITDFPDDLDAGVEGAIFFGDLPLENVRSPLGKLLVFATRQGNIDHRIQRVLMDGMQPTKIMT